MNPSSAHEFSETQFLFCFLNELLSNHPHAFMPMIPTQRKEKNVGYDANITIGSRVLFLQFKIPEFRKRKKAKYFKDFDAPYYVFRIHNKTSDDQHSTLTKLAIQCPGSVYYCTPNYITYEELEDSYNNNKVMKNSKIIDCGQMNLQGLSNKDHDITFKKEEYFGFVHSEKIEIELFNYESIKEKTSLFEGEEKFITKIKEAGIDIENATDIKAISEVLFRKYNIFLLLIPE